jgi:N-acetylmuramoyl-L-alanine amidase
MAKILRQQALILSVGIVLCVFILNSCIHFDRFGRTKYQPFRIGSVEYIALDSLCYKFDIECDWNKRKGVATLRKAKKELSLYPKSQSLKINGVTKQLIFPMIKKGDRLMLPREFEKFQWWSEAQEAAFPKRFFKESLEGKAVVVVDVGHGGHEAGAVANGIQEKDITFRVAQALQRNLEAAGIVVIMTRDIDEYLSLPDRSWIGNTIKPNVFVSVHANAAPNIEASGFEIYHVPQQLNGSKASIHDSDKENKDYRMKRNSLLKKQKTIEEISSQNRQKSAELAKEIHRHVIKSVSNIKDRGVRQAEFFVIKWVDVPSVLIELGFVTNFLEGSRLMNPEYQEDLAASISSAVQKYIQKNPRLA